ncbi:MAG: cupin domain-containing protein [Polymorphobacter sp.]
MPKVDLDALPVLRTSGYLPPYDAAVAGRSRRAIGVGLREFGVNLVRLEPGAWSSQRHWHSAEDELVYMVAGEAVLIEDGGETLLRPGDVASFPQGVANGHHLVNRSSVDAVFIAVGNDASATDECHYPDADMFWSEATGYVRKPHAG